MYLPSTSAVWSRLGSVRRQLASALSGRSKQRLARAVAATVEPLEHRTLLSVTISYEIDLAGTTTQTSSVAEGTAIQLNNVAATSDSGGTIDQTYSVDWGDGSPQESHSWGDAPTHAYYEPTGRNPRQIAVWTNETNSDGSTDQSCVISPETVTEATPTIKLQGDASVQEGSTYTITPSFSDPGEDPVLQWTISWVQNTSETDAAASTYSHVYNVPGSYTITATPTSEDGQYSAVQLTVDVTGPAPSSPSNLIAVASGSKVNLTWNASTGPLTSYYVQRSTDGSTFTNIATDVQTNSYTDTTGTPNTEYWYQVYAYNGDTPSPAPTNHPWVTLPPAAPAGLSATASSNLVSLTWSSSIGASTYTVQRKGPNDSSYSALPGSPTSSTSLTDSGVSPGTAYSYQVLANGVGGASDPATILASTAPTAPTGVTAVASGTQVAVSWSASTGNVTAYHIQRSTNGSSYTDLSTTVPGGTTTFTDTGLAAGTPYRYAVYADYNGSKSPVAYAQSQPTTTQPPTPTGLTATPTSPTAVSLSWSAATSATSYTVLRKGPNDSSYLPLPTTYSTTLTDAGLAPSTAYLYEVEASNAAGTSQPSTPPVTATTPAPPQMPTGLTLRATGTPSVTLNWTAPGGTVTGYNIERSTDGGAFSGIASNWSGTSYTDTGVLAGHTYSYAVQSSWSGSTSGYCSAQQIPLIPATPAAPSVSSALPNSVALAWTAPFGATSFQILRQGPADTSHVLIGTSASATFNDTRVSQQNSYSYEIRAVNAAGASPAGPAATATTPAAPAAPTNLTATVNSGPQVALSWTASGSSISNYHVERSVDGTNFTEIASTQQTTYTDTSVSAAGTYSYRVFADWNGADSDYSNVAVAGPSAPPDFTITSSGSPASFSWTAVTGTGTITYHIERSTDGTNFTELYPPPTDTTYTDTTMQPGAGYSYRVRAQDSDFYSDYSTTLQLTMPPAAPTNLLAVLSSGQVTLSWNAPAGATSYSVMRGAADGSSFETIGTVTTPGFTDSSATAGSPHEYEIIASNGGGDSAASTPVAPVQTLTPVILGRWIFYNKSSFDGNSDAINSSDDAAIATDKQALRPGQGSTFANYTSFSNGINGIMVDVANLAGTPTASDFTFKVSALGDASTWSDAPAPGAVTVRPGAGINGSSRIEITWADGAIKNQWLQVTVAANGNTGLALSDTFYFGNLIGSYSAKIVDGQYTVGANDMNAARNDPHTVLSPAPITDPCDFNRDGTIDALDQLIARTNYQASPSPTLPTLLGSPGAPYLVSASASQIQIGWPAPSDPNVTSYDVYRDGQLLVSAISSPTYTDTVSAGTSHTYWVVSRDASGGSSIPSATLTATAALSGSAPVLDPVTGVHGYEGQSITINDPFSDSDSGDTHTVNFDWGDGTTSPGTVDESGHMITGTHTYSSSDSYSATIALTDQNGGTFVLPLTIGVVPTAPTTLVALAGSDSTITLTWAGHSPSATQYQIQVLGNEDSPDEWSYFDEVPAWQTSYTASGLSAGQSYTFQIVAVSPGGLSLPSNSASATTGTVATPSAPTTNVVSTSEIDLSWSNNAQEATSFEVDWSTDGTNFQPLATDLPADATTYNATNLVPGTSYTFRVQAFADPGASDYSATASATTIPDAPTGLSARPDNSGNVDVTWNDVAGESSFIVERSTDDNSWQQVDQTSAAGQTSYTDASVSPGTSYYYRVSASDGSDTSATSDPAMVTVLPKISGLTATAKSATEIDLSWSGGGQPATGTRVEQSTDGSNYFLVATVSGSASSYNVTGLDATTKYYFRVRASDGANDPSQGATADATTLAADSGSLVSTPGSPYAEDPSAVASIGMGLNLYGLKFDSVGIGDDGAILLSGDWQDEYDIYYGTAFPETQIIAPFLGEVDLELGGSETYGPTTYQGHTAWKVNWTGVSEWNGTSTPSGPTNTFSVTLVDRSDVTSGDFDIVFDYGTMNWDSGFQYNGAEQFIPIAGYSNGSGAAGTFKELAGSGADGGLSSLAGTSQVFQIRNPTLTAYRTGNNMGVPVTDAVKKSGDPTQYVMLVGDAIDPNTNVPFNAESTLPIQNNQPTNGPDGKPLDPDLARITLHQVPQGFTSGQVQISASDPGAVKFFDKNGNQLTQTSLDLSSPSGYLSGLTSGDVDVWVEGMHASSDLTLKYSFIDATGKEISSDTIHMDIAQWSFIGKNGSPITSVEKDTMQLLEDMALGDPNAPQAADDVYFKAHIDGLPASAIQSLTVQSDTVSSDQFSDTLVSDGTGVESADWAAIYSTPDDQSDLTAAEIQKIKSMYALNVVHNADAVATFETTDDSNSRTLTGDAADFSVIDLYNAFSSSNNGDDKVKFVLDHMNFQNDPRMRDQNGTDVAWKWRVVLGGIDTAFKVSDYNIYINSGYKLSGFTLNDTKGLLVSGLREWAGNGVLGTIMQPAQQTSTNMYFASISRQYARSFYYDVGTFIPYASDGSDEFNPDTDSGMVNGVRGGNRYYVAPELVAPRTDAAVVSAALTLDFLYLFSAQNQGSGYAAEVKPGSVSVPSLYLWVFSNNRSVLPGQRATAYTVNIPPEFGMDPSYFEANTDATQATTDLYHDTNHVNNILWNGGKSVWPDEDQLHHFAAYFYIGAEFKRAAQDKHEKDPTESDEPSSVILPFVLHGSGDWPGASGPTNPGDYNLGIVGWDIGILYQRGPGSVGNVISTRLSEPAPKAFADAGRVWPFPE